MSGLPLEETSHDSAAIGAGERGHHVWQPAERRSSHLRSFPPKYALAGAKPAGSVRREEGSVVEQSAAHEPTFPGEN